LVFYSLLTAKLVRVLRLVGSLFIITAGCTAINQPDAMCAPSLITVEPSSASPGESVVVTGENFFRGCSDVGGSKSTPEMDPELGIQVEFRQGSQSWPLATVDARANYSFDEVVEVPGTATEGPAAFVAFGDDRMVEEEFNVL
jgi:hypothetical protein